MLKIRLSRFGKKKEAHYRIVVVEARTKRDGYYIDQVGYYNPRTNPSTISFEKEKLNEWISKGAQPTDTVKGLMVKEGLMKKDFVEQKATAKAKKTATKTKKTAKKETK